MASEALQPGIRFETQPPAPASVLPRMDIAALVGLAASGPLDLPVPVEDVPRFRDLFGPDPVLAWDAERQGYQRGLLGPTVEGFFRNGGRRCWVVRVAGGEAETARFRLPGLLSATGAEPARLVARSPGTWAESLRVAPLLTRAPLQARQGPGAVGGSDLAAIRAEGRGPSHPEAQLDLAEAAGVVVTGDLLELLWPDIGVLMWGFVTARSPLPTGSRVSMDIAAWFSLSDGLGSPQHPPGHRIEIDQETALDLLAGWLADPQRGAPLAARLGLELRVEAPADRGGDAAARRWRMTDLAFDDRHPRFLGALPDDAALFAPEQGRARPPLPAQRAALLADAAGGPRFPLAADGGLTGRWLPLGLAAAGPEPGFSPTLQESPGTAGGDADHPWRTAEPPREPDPAARDGLERFDPQRFADPVLMRLGTGTLIPQARHRYYLEQRPLRGLHSLLPVTEVTLVAVPDATHRGWEHAALPAGEWLVAPLLGGGPAPGGTLARLCWTSVATATGYQLQRRAPADAWRDVARGTDPRAEVPWSPGCVAEDAFRVRGLRGGRPGPLVQHPGVGARRSDAIQPPAPRGL